MTFSVVHHTHEFRNVVLEYHTVFVNADKISVWWIITIAKNINFANGVNHLHECRKMSFWQWCNMISFINTEKWYECRFKKGKINRKKSGASFIFRNDEKCQFVNGIYYCNIHEYLKGITDSASCINSVLKIHVRLKPNIPGVSEKSNA